MTELEGCFVYARFPSMHALGYKDQLARIASIDHETGCVNLVREDGQPLFNGAEYITCEPRGNGEVYYYAGSEQKPRRKFGYFAVSDLRFTLNVGGR